MYDMSVLVADLLLVWRLYIIWPGKKLLYLGVAVLLLCMTGESID